MGARNPYPKPENPKLLEVLTVITAHEPHRDFTQDHQRKVELSWMLMALAANGVTDAGQLRSLAGWRDRQAGRSWFCRNQHRQWTGRHRQGHVGGAHLSASGLFEYDGIVSVNFDCNDWLFVRLRRVGRLKSTLPADHLADRGFAKRLSPMGGDPAFEKNSDPGRIRTFNPLLRRQGTLAKAHAFPLLRSH